MAKDSARTELEKLIDRLHKRNRLRVWSIVITVFGDAAVPRGGVLWLGALQAITERLGIESGALRAAMSRLASDGWLSRVRRGRNSYYALAPAGRRDFDLATRRIYAPGSAAWSGRWTICIAPEEAGEARDQRRRRLRDLGFGTVGPTVFLRPDTEGAPDAGDATADAFVFTAEGEKGPEFADLAQEAWPLDAVELEYERIVAAYSPLLECLEAGDNLAPLDAMAARTLLVHDFRRVALKDPVLPDALRPAAWHGDAARSVAGRLYRALTSASEQWLDHCDGAPDGQLPPPSPDFYDRFGGLGE
jgi:phenylacetic acid degradation operon negative regulatory protein